MNKKLILKISGRSPYPHNLFVGFSINKLCVSFNKFGISNLLGHLLFVGSKIAKSKNLTNWRTVINNGAESGQTVFHLHIHYLSGRKMNWPPG